MKPHFLYQVQDASDDVVKNGKEPPAKKARTVSESAPAETETKMVKHNLKFCSLEEALKVDWTKQDYAKRLKRMDPSFFVLQVCYLFSPRSSLFRRSLTRGGETERQLTLPGFFNET